MFCGDTENLEKAFQNAGMEGFPECFSDNRTEMLTEQRDFMNFMNDALRRKGLKKQEILLKADVPLRYGYKLLAEEKRTQKRDVILRIGYAAELTLKEMQRALKIYGMSPLYIRNRRDAILIICFCQRRKGIHEVNAKLLEHGVSPLQTVGASE